VDNVLHDRTAIQSKSDIKKTLSQAYGSALASRVMLSADDMQAIESKWRSIWRDELEDLSFWLIDKALRTGQLDVAAVDFQDLAMEHSLDVMARSLEDSSLFIPDVLDEDRRRLAKGTPPPRAMVPTNFAELRALWDKFRKKRYIPPRQRSIAERIKKAYLYKVQSAWAKYGEGFRSGETAVRNEAVNAVMKQAMVSYSRAKMIVETETTYYYNKVRRSVFDQSPDVTHYLFMAIRDHRTTEWCKTRHGLVYSKKDPLLKSEQPPIHWNCRSEILPLTELNPTHKAMIDDPSRSRRNHKCKPLPSDWGPR
jgi:SPP1 gp7 family putative phage head morphogenesis protein